MANHRTPPYVVSLTHHPQLFLDDRCIGNRLNLKRQMQQPLKFEGNPIMPVEHPWEQRHMYRPSVIFEPQANEFRMHYTTIAGAKPKASVAVCYAESDDGFTWRKCLTNSFLYEGRPSNIVPGPSHAIKTPHDAMRPYIGVFGKVLTGKEFTGRGLHVASSPDGLHWESPHSITKTKCDTIPSIVWHEPVQRYFVYTRAQMHHHALDGHLRITGVMESSDFETWTAKRAINLIPETEGFPYVQAHALTAHAYGDLLIGQVPVLSLEESGNNFLGRFDIQLAVSRDGWTWNRVANGAIFMPPGPENWDRWYVHSCSMTRKDDTLYFYYNGRSQKHGAVRQLIEQGVEVEMPTPKGSIGVATLPADRFVALQPIDSTTPGVLDTPPVRFAGRELFINAELDPADFQVELIDEQGPVTQYQATPVTGFDRNHSKLVRHDELRHRVVWQCDGTERALGDAPLDRPVILRFLLRRGKLFAFQVGNSRSQGPSRPME